jgi:hypothetical protein
MIIPAIEVETPSWTTTPVKRKIDPIATKLLSTGKVFVAGGYARWLTEKSKWLKEKVNGVNSVGGLTTRVGGPTRQPNNERENTSRYVGGRAPDTGNCGNRSGI